MLIDPRLERTTDAPHITWGRQKSGWKSHAWYNDIHGRWVALCGMLPSIQFADGGLRTTMELRSEGPVCETCEHRDNEGWAAWWETHAQTGE